MNLPAPRRWSISACLKEKNKSVSYVLCELSDAECILGETASESVPACLRKQAGD